MNYKEFYDKVLAEYNKVDNDEYFTDVIYGLLKDVTIKDELCPECDSEIAVCMMGHYCGEVIPNDLDRKGKRDGNSKK